METPTIHKRWRPRVRFSLRALIVVMTVLCLFLGHKAHRAREQRQAVAALEAAGAQVSYQQSTVTGWLFPPTFNETEAASGGAWFRQWIGDEYFGEVNGIYWVFESAPEPGVFANLARLPQLNWLILHSNCSIQLDALPSMKSLEQLSVRGCRITDDTMEQIGHQWSLNKLTLELQQGAVNPAGFEHLLGLQRLSELDLSGSAIGDELLPVIGRMPALQSLDLSFTNITEAGLAHLDTLPALREFTAVGGLQAISMTRVSSVALGDTALITLARHEQLTSLRIGMLCFNNCPPARITGKGLAALAELPLVDLSLYNAALTDSDIATLKAMETLQTVRLTGADFSPDGIQQLKVSCPSAQFRFDQF